ncbi:alanine dehydrogenase [Cellulomonas chengniuliangii]|uniref:Alanine dehydrogenase n=1 Tax=Cellulomonas chengniuliangii TaxID=2968084 RepID=A0ABY5L1N1_9CELL|nr:alanine dehydrogenase [Cellulomonas chengniuliangii]MCC2308155.1 alanine dehydrogenase [Cellulomonas chengniuliangii]UUI76549.1 alanine dehydrogenase [Cellulomonas chengniuliangii]
MRIGIPTEVKNREYRVAITPAGVDQLVTAGHEVLVQAGAGSGSAISDALYADAGAQVLPRAADVWEGADLVCKVKEPVPSEYGYLREDLVLFAYLHLAADKPTTDALLASGATAIAYETVQLEDGSLPLLAPMSEVAGRLAAQVGAYHLMKSVGGSGKLLGGVPGVDAATVVVIGGGVAGRNAAEIARGMRADVTVLDVSSRRLRELDMEFQGSVRTLASNAYTLEREVADADLVIGAVLVPGARAPRLVSTELISRMRPGSVLVDVAVDQGGCFEPTRPTTHDEPTFRVGGAVLYAVANMPGVVPVTSTRALTNATLPYLSALADHGWRAATTADPALAAGLTVHGGSLLSPEIAAAHGYTASAPPGLPG